jgi:hypothetical protein
MLVRNYAKPFCIAGIILAEIYMLLVMLAPYGHEGRPLPAPIPFEDTVAPGAPIPGWYLAVRILVGSVFFGPLGALVGLGIGLIFSGLMQWWRRRAE